MGTWRQFFEITLNALQRARRCKKKNKNTKIHHALERHEGKTEVLQRGRSSRSRECRQEKLYLKPRNGEVSRTKERHHLLDEKHILSFSEKLLSGLDHDRDLLVKQVKENEQKTLSCYRCFVREEPRHKTVIVPKSRGKQLNLELYARHLKDKEIFPDVKTSLRQGLQTRHS